VETVLIAFVLTNLRGQMVQQRLETIIIMQNVPTKASVIEPMANANALQVMKVKDAGVRLALTNVLGMALASS
jgi:hypothetical protein